MVCRLIFFSLILISTARADDQYPVVQFDGGSNWGTEWLKELNNKFASHLEDLPSLFQTQGKLNQSQPFYVGQNQYTEMIFGVARGKNKASLFTNFKVNLFSQLHICFDQNLNVQLSSLEPGLMYLQDLLNGIPSSKYKSKNEIRIYITSSTLNIDHDNLSHCSLIFKKSSESDFPYKEIQQKDKPIAIYFKLNSESIPIIAIRPDVHLSSTGYFHHYIWSTKGQVFAHAPSLILHEVGHALGFEHVFTERYNYDQELNIMSLKVDTQTQFLEDIVQRRYGEAQDMSRNWDLRQISVYKRSLWHDQTQTDNTFLPDRIVCLNNNEMILIPFKTIDYESMQPPATDVSTDEISLDRVPPLFKHLLQTKLAGHWGQFYQISDSVYVLLSSNYKEPIFDRIEFKIEKFEKSWRTVLKIKVNLPDSQKYIKIQYYFTLWQRLPDGTAQIVPANITGPLALALTPPECNQN